MAKDFEEAEQKPKVEQKKVSAQESEDLQRKGWKVVSMTRENGKRVHTLEKK